MQRETYEAHKYPDLCPPACGFYRPQDEHDACGIGIIADLKRGPSHQVISDALSVLRNLEHRGAVGSDKKTGDGAGILCRIPQRFFEKEMAAASLSEPYGIGMFFLPSSHAVFLRAQKLIADISVQRGFELRAWRNVPVVPQVLGTKANESLPRICQAAFVKKASTAAPSGAGNLAPAGAATPEESGPRDGTTSTESFERELFMLRKYMEKEAKTAGFTLDQFYIASLSSRTIVYKGMFVASQFASFYPDLEDPLFESQFAVVHQRYSTNTFPSWPLAQPFRMIAHNGEINTLRKNINSMKARQATMASGLLGQEFFHYIEVLEEDGSDSAIFDNIFELLVQAGRSPEHVFMMMVQEPIGQKLGISNDKRAFYDFHSAMLETWDGPAAMCFTDGKTLGAALDRNGLRPFRYSLSREGYFLGASEAGVLARDESGVEERGILRPGQMFLLDLQKGRFIGDAEIKTRISRQNPYRRWLEANRIELRGLFLNQELRASDRDTGTAEALERAAAYFLYDRDTAAILKPMMLQKQEATSAMTSKRSPAILSRSKVPLYAYFRQRFAQVTNPPIDSYREAAMMSLENYIGTQKNLLEETAAHCRQLKLQRPILSNGDMERLRASDLPDFRVATVSMCFPVAEPEFDLKAAMAALCAHAEREINQGASLIVLSDRGVDVSHASIPAILALSALHTHLVDAKKRHLAGLVVETGEARDVHEIAVLLAYGASGVNPWLVFERIPSLATLWKDTHSAETLADNYIAAVNKGILKIMSKMGISTVSSYRGSRLFEIVGFSDELVAHYFRGTVSTFGGIGLEEISRQVAERHREAFASNGKPNTSAKDAAVQYTAAKETAPLISPWPPSLAAKLVEAVRMGNAASWRAYADGMSSEFRPPFALRDLWGFKPMGPIPLEEVQPAEEIIARFSVAAMSLGALSPEAHEALAAGSNSVGSWSNTGEGGEDADRASYAELGLDSRNMSKQVASGRFGMTARYLAEGLELQIKIAQGAKPGEGGQLPGLKVNEYIATLRHSKPGVTLISPPPHHDIYSIEDLSQLIHDLRCINPGARIAVKLTAESGIGTVAAGVVKAGSDCVIVSSGDGGTGAAPLSSLDHAGNYWEQALPEIRQVLAMNGLDINSVIQVDGRLRTARDIVIAAILGAREFAFGILAMLSMGCTACGQCNVGKCPAGITTQDPEFRAKFRGRPEHLAALFRFLAEDVRTILASLGLQSLDALSGRYELIDFGVRAHSPRETSLSFDHIKEALEIARRYPLFDSSVSDAQSSPSIPLPPAGLRNFHQSAQRESAISEAESRILQACAPLFAPAAAREPTPNSEMSTVPRAKFDLSIPITNADRSVGAALSGQIARAGLALAPDSICVNFSGAAGQSFGAFLEHGVLFRLYGEANDYVGKSLSGGRIVVRPRVESRGAPEDNVIAGNVCLYGATSGEVYLNGKVGERFCVRNSGALAVAEGAGNHACEYMTDGIVVILGSMGLNFGAGMTGGVAYVLDEDQFFDTRCNSSDVDVCGVTQPEDIEELRSIIERHHALTGSPRAKGILAEWDSYLPRFLKVTPLAQ